MLDWLNEEWNRLATNGEAWVLWSEWLVAALVSLVLLLLLVLARGIVGRRARRRAEQRATGYAGLVAGLAESTKLLFVVIASVFVGSLFVEIGPRAQTVTASVAIIALLVQGGVWANVAVTFFVTRYTERRMEADPGSVTTVSVLAVASRIAIISLVVLLILDNLGVDITAMVAGLGIGGVAVALAAQNILGDLFASASIALDKPFVIGDFIIVGEQLGTVERIGLKTTRVRSLSGEQLIFSNNDLLQSRIRNFKRMYQRRVVFRINVVYQTPYEKLAAIAPMLREAVEAQEQTRFDRAHFAECGSHSLDYEVVYFVLSPDFNLYMDIQQAINLAIVRRFEEEGIEFAYPTQTIFVERAGSTTLEPAAQ